MHFFGTLDDLKARVATLGLDGVWETDKTGAERFRARTGPVVIWWPTKGTLLVQGKHIDDVAARLAALCETEVQPAPTPPTPDTKQKIFLVYGHDREARDQLELILMRFGLKPFILQNNDAGSMTVIQALEKNIYEESAFGIVLMTPDDFGFSKAAGETEKQPRVRQNVLLEMGMVMAALGRSKMAIIQKGALERPSDTDGVVRLEYNDHIREVAPKLAERLRAAGFAIDAAAIASASS